MRKGKLVNRILGIVLVLVMIGGTLGWLPALVSRVEASPATIYVPDDYSTIQATVDATSLDLFPRPNLPPASADTDAGTPVASGVLSGSYPRQLARTSDGAWHCVYHRSAGTYTQIYHSKSTDGGETWTEEQVTTASLHHYQPSVAIDSNDNIHVAWIVFPDGDPIEESYGYLWPGYPGYPGRVSTVQYRMKTTAWQSVEDVKTGYHTVLSIAVDSENNVHLVIGGHNPGAWNCEGINYTKRTASGWGPIERVSSGCWTAAAAIAIDENNTVHVVYAHGPYFEPRYEIVYRQRTSSGWGSEIQLQSLDDSISGGISIAVDTNNHIHVVWGWRERQGNNYGIKYRRFTTFWEPIEILEGPTLYLQYMPIIAVDSNDHIHVVWSGQHTDSPTYYQLRYREYTTTWQPIQNLTCSASADQTNPSLMWAFYPTVSGMKTNQPEEGCSFVWMDGTTIRYWSGEPVPPPGHTPVSHASDISGQPQVMHPDTEYTVTAKYFDPDGRDDLKYCYLRLDHPDKDLTMGWDEATDDFWRYAGEEGANYLTVTGDSNPISEGGLEGYELAWTFTINDQWPEVENAIDFGVYAWDDADLTSGWDYDTTKASFLLNVNQPPVASFNYMPQSPVRSGDYIEFSAWSSFDPDSPNGTIANYMWDFGDGTMESGNDKVTVTHRFRGAYRGNSKIYDVTLTVEDALGATSETTKQVHVLALSKAVEVTRIPHTPLTAEASARLTVWYNWVDVDEVSGENIYIVSKARAEADGWIGYYSYFIEDTHSGDESVVIWWDLLSSYINHTYYTCFSGPTLFPDFSRLLPKWQPKKCYVFFYGTDVFEGFAVYGSDVMRLRAVGIPGGVALGTIPAIIAAQALATGFAAEDTACFDPEDSFEPPEWRGIDYPLWGSTLGSPGELTVYDTEGRITGVIDGDIVEEIPNSISTGNEVLISSAYGSYTIRIAGTDTGLYGLSTAFLTNGDEITAFNATSIPIAPNQIHQYTLDWDALSQGEEGVTVQIDSDGDGVFERTITSGSELTGDEFVLQTETVIDFDPDVVNLRARGRFVTVYIELPEGYDVEQIDVSSIMLNGTIPALTRPTEIGDYNNNGVPDLMVKFDRQAVSAVLEEGEDIEISVIGEVDGIQFMGTDTIRVIGP